MTLLATLKEDLKSSLKAKQQTKLNVLRQLLASIKNSAIEIGKAEDQLDEQEVIKALKKEAKKRKDSIESFKQGGRQELAQQEQQELDIINTYLPQELGEDEIKKVVQEVVSNMGEITPSDFGNIMKEVMAKLNGQADGKLVSQLVKQQLS